MKRIVTVLGYGERGQAWARCALRAGWKVRVFDTEGTLDAGHADVTQHDLISTAVDGADCIVLCLPDRLSLHRKIIQHLQTLCGSGTLLVAMSETSKVHDLQGCAKWPESVVHLVLSGKSKATLNVTDANLAVFVENSEKLIKSMGYKTNVIHSSAVFNP